MQRLVYSPKIQCWVKGDTGTVDLTPYITECVINRKIDQVSNATVSFRNPRKLFTEPAPVFHPMDPIIIALTRLRGRPVQVFTGYCDTTPYLQLYPGIATIQASCTLKRLQYTFWDPALDFVQRYMEQYGWLINREQGAAINPAAATQPAPTKPGGETDLPALIKSFNDGSIANLMAAVLRDVGGWTEDTYYIEPLPPTIGPLVAALFADFKTENVAVREGFEDLLTKIIGTASIGTGDGSASTDDAVPADLQNFPKKDVYSKGELLGLLKALGFADPALGVKVIMCESSGNSKVCNSSDHCGLWQMSNDHGLTTAQRQDPIKSSQWAKANSKGGKDFTGPWAASRGCWG